MNHHRRRIGRSSPSARAVGSVPLVAVALLSACRTWGGTSPAGAAEADTVADAYFAPAPPASATPLDPLANAVLADALAASGRPLAADVALARACMALARAYAEDGKVPTAAAQEFLLAQHGVGGALPSLTLLRVAARDEAIRTRLADVVAARRAAEPVALIGVGVARRWPETSVVVALQRREVEMLPVPRALPAGGSALIAGRLLGEARNPVVLVAPPRGDVLTLAVSQTRDSFQATFACTDAPGAHQVEVLASGPFGKTVVANFPVYCAQPPPPRFVPVRDPDPEAESLTDGAPGAAVALRLVNRDRAAAGLPALIYDPRVAAVAQQTSEEMASAERLAHVSETSGNAADRVARAGVTVSVILENLARAASLADAQRSLMSSPSHRANVLSRGVHRIGIGVTRHADGGDSALTAVYVTQLFVR